MKPQDPTPIALRPGQPVRLPTSRAAWLTVLEGRVWLTCRNDADDHFLAAGEGLRLPAGADAVLEADGGRPARCVVQAVGALQAVDTMRASDLEALLPAGRIDDKAPAAALS